MALSGLLFGFNEFAMRLPSALAGVMLVWVIGRMARRLSGDGAGFAAALVLAALPGFVVHQSVCRADVMVALASAIAFDRFLAVAGGDARRRSLVIGYQAVAAGILAKGPLAVALPSIGIVAWLYLYRRWRVLLDLEPWLGLPAVIGLVGTWYLAAYRIAGWEFIHLNLMLENVEAFARGFEQREPWWFYVAAGAYRTLPWLLILPLMWFVRRTPGLGIAVVWAAGIFLLLSASAAKRGSYLALGVVD
jgi:4-amino-4-deoxy-L-arabinose transferase-like glycosyltransferase